VLVCFENEDVFSTIGAWNSPNWWMDHVDCLSESWAGSRQGPMTIYGHVVTCGDEQTGGM